MAFAISAFWQSPYPKSAVKLFEFLRRVLRCAGVLCAVCSRRAAKMVIYILVSISVGVVGLFVVAWLAGVRYIPHNRVGIVEKLWSGSGFSTRLA